VRCTNHCLPTLKEIDIVSIFKVSTSTHHWRAAATGYKGSVGVESSSIDAATGRHLSPRHPYKCASAISTHLHRPFTQVNRSTGSAYFHCLVFCFECSAGFRK